MHHLVERAGDGGLVEPAQEAVQGREVGNGAQLLSTFFVRRMDHHNQQPMPWRHWLKWLVVVALHRQLVLAQKAHAGPTNDGANLRPLLDTAHSVSSIGLVLADAEFDSELNHTHFRQRLGARSIIPAKRGKKTWRIQRGTRHNARPLSASASTGSAAGELAFGSGENGLDQGASAACLLTQRRQALLLGLTYNLYRL